MSVVGAKKILITGGAGFIGFHLAQQLAKEKTHHITLVDNLVKGKMDADLNALLKQSNVTFVAADLTDLAAYAMLGKGYDQVYHLAAFLGVGRVLDNPHETLRVNTLSTFYLVDWLVNGGGKKILFASTSEVYAWTKDFYELPIPTPEDIPCIFKDLNDARTSYALSKVVGESAVRHYCRHFSLPFVVVRYYNIYGPRMGFDHVVPELYLRARRGQDPLLVYSPEHTRAFCYVTDAVTATIQAMHQVPAEGETINIGTDAEEICIGDLAKKILHTAGFTNGITAAQARNDPVSRRCPDITKAKELLGFSPRVTLDDGLRQTLAWYAERA